MQTVRRLLKVNLYAQPDFGIVAPTTISHFMLDSVPIYAGFFLMLDTGSENSSSGLAAGPSGRDKDSNDEYEANLDFKNLCVIRSATDYENPSCTFSSYSGLPQALQRQE